MASFWEQKALKYFADHNKYEKYLYNFGTYWALKSALFCKVGLFEDNRSCIVSLASFQALYDRAIKSLSVGCSICKHYNTYLSNKLILTCMNTSWWCFKTGPLKRWDIRLKSKIRSPMATPIRCVGYKRSYFSIRQYFV